MKPKLEALILSTLKEFIKIRKGQDIKIKKEIDKVMKDYIRNVTINEPEARDYFQSYYDSLKNEKN